jgi:hypothetical protein
MVFGNRLLDLLPSEERNRIAPFMRRCFLDRGQRLGALGERFDFLYFPVDALVWSWSSSVSISRRITNFAFGRSGATGTARALDFFRQDTHFAVVSPGEAWRVDATVLELIESPMRRALMRFEHAAFAVTCAQLTCNSEHNIDRRLARWLLWMNDEIGCSEVTIAQRELAELATIRRPSISLACSNLQRLGALRIQRCRMETMNRSLLERAACQCYGLTRALIEQWPRARLS